MTDQIVVRGAREHNLRNISLELPRDALIVFTGLSGSGKSSLAFDTIFAEGQRRYVESLSAYARQFLGQMDKPDVDFIEGLSPAVSIDQKSTSRNPRSTVGTITEVYDYLRLLYARAGRPHCPICGEPISRQSPQQIVDRLLALEEGTRFQVLAPVIRGRKGEYVELFRQLAGEGFARARVDGEIVIAHRARRSWTRSTSTPSTWWWTGWRSSRSVKQRLTDSVETALGLAQGDRHHRLRRPATPSDPLRERRYSEKLACPNDHDIAIDELEPRQFSFNGPWGACPECSGLGTRMEVDPELVVPDDEKTLDEGAIAPVVVGAGRRLLPAADLLAGRDDAASARTVPWHSLPSAAKKILLYGVPGPGARPLPQPVRPGAQLQRQVRGRRLLHRAAARRGRDRHVPGAVRRLHARGAVHGLPRRPAEADLAGRDRRRQEHRRGREPVDRRGRRLPLAVWSSPTARSRSPSGCSRRSTSGSGSCSTSVWTTCR